MDAQTALAPAQATERPDPARLPVPQGRTAEVAPWQRSLWISVACSLGLTILLLLGFVAWTVGRVTDLMTGHRDADLAFAFAGMTLVTLTLLRLLAILIGAGLAFAGLVVSFYNHAQVTRLGASQGGGAAGFRASLATGSPGIAAIVVGAVIILCALFAQGTYSYRPGSHAAQDSAAPATPLQYRSAEDILREVEGKK